MLQQSRKFAAMSSSSAISGGIGNSGISVDELVYLEWDFSKPSPFNGSHLVLYVKYMHTFWRTWLGISRKFTFNARAIPTIERDFTLPHWSHSLQIGQDQRALPETQNIGFLFTFHCKVQGHIYRSHHVYCVFSAITLIVPEVRAWSLATINSCPSLLISFTYLNWAMII